MPYLLISNGRDWYLARTYQFKNYMTFKNGKMGVWYQVNQSKFCLTPNGVLIMTSDGVQRSLRWIKKPTLFIANGNDWSMARTYQYQNYMIFKNKKVIRDVWYQVNQSKFCLTSNGVFIKTSDGISRRLKWIQCCFECN